MPDPAPVVPPRSAEAWRAAGVSKHVLSGPRFRRTSYGMYVPASVGDSPDQRIAEAVACMPSGSALAGWASAYRLGARAFSGRDPVKRPVPVPISVAAPLHREPGPGVRYVRQVLEADEVVDIGGVTVVAASRTASDLACWAPNLSEAVSAVDALLTARVVDLPDLGRSARRLHGRRGAKQARLALQLARPGRP